MSAEQKAAKEAAKAVEKTDGGDMGMGADDAAREREIIAQLKRQRKVKLVIASGAESHERSPVPVAVNGREYLIERDKEVLVPEAVANVLALARKQVCERVDDGRGTPRMVFREAPRFSYQILGYADGES